MSQTTPKWDIGTTIFRGHQAIGLLDKFPNDLSRRLKPEEMELLRTGVPELEMRQSGQPENLNLQKVSTQGKKQSLENIHTNIIDFRGMVKAATSDAQILKAFGVGENLNIKSPRDQRAAANMIINGYNTNSSWAKEKAGMLEEDLLELEAQSSKLTDVDSMQEQAKLNRKVKTIDKDVLQRQIEDLITKFSAVGIKEFRTKNPALIPLFEALVSSSSTPSEAPVQDEKPEEEIVKA